MSVFINIGNGGFNKSYHRSDVSGAINVAVGDLNGDGHLDFAILAREANSLIVYLGDGGGSFNRNLVDFRAYGPFGIVFGDVDSDGDLDIVVAVTGNINTMDEDLVVWMESDGSGLSFTQHNLTNEADGARGLDLVDWDMDGDLDLFVASLADHTLWYFEMGDGSYDSGRRVNEDCLGAIFVDVADFTRDGQPDVLVTSRRDGYIRLFEHTAVNTALEANSRVFEPVVIESGLQGLWASRGYDLDGDGDLDIASAGESSGVRAYYSNCCVEEEGATTFSTTTSNSAPAQSTTAETIAPTTTTSITAATSTNQCSVPAGGCTVEPFVADLGVDQVDGPHHLQIGDIDGDGIQDIVVASSDGHRVEWLQVGASFNTTASIIADFSAESGDPRSVQLVDADLDGDPDVVVVWQGIGTITLHRNDGKGNFVFAEFIDQSLVKPFNSAIADFNSDGYLDLAVTDRRQDLIALYFNLGNESTSTDTFVRLSGITNVNGAYDIEAADMNRDGLVDIIAGVREEDKIVIYYNTGEDGTGDVVFVPDVISSDTTPCNDPRSGRSL